MKNSASAVSDRSRDRDRLLRALSHQRRRSALRLLQRHGEVTISELAERVARRENGGSISDVSPEDRAEIHLNLYHCHVPILVEAGLIAYEEKREVVRLSDRDVNVEACLDALTG